MNDDFLSCDCCPQTLTKRTRRKGWLNRAYFAWQEFKTDWPQLRADLKEEMERIRNER